MAVALVLATGAPGESTAVIVQSGLPPSAAAAPAPVPIPHDTLVRVPGSPLRLGWSLERASALGSFHLTESSAAAISREGELSWFAAPAKALLTFREGRLAEIRLTATGVSGRFVSYVPDDLRRQGYRRTSEEVSAGTSVTEWLGRARIRLTISPASVIAEVSARPWDAAASAPAGSAATSAGEAAREAARDRKSVV